MSDAPRPAGQVGRASPSRAPGDYEFSEAHKESFASVAASMSFVGVCVMLLGAVSALFAVVAAYAGFIVLAVGLGAGAAVVIPMAWWTMSAGRSLSALVRTRGRDVDHLMAAVAQLRRLFGFGLVFVILTTMAMIAVFAVGVWCQFIVERGGRCFGVG
jgi:hypothetical protein